MEAEKQQHTIQNILENYYQKPSIQPKDTNLCLKEKYFILVRIDYILDFQKAYKSFTSYVHVCGQKKHLHSNFQTVIPMQHIGTKHRLEHGKTICFLNQKFKVSIWHTMLKRIKTPPPQKYK